jgi:hypothetical protein
LANLPINLWLKMMPQSCVRDCASNLSTIILAYRHLRSGILSFHVARLRFLQDRPPTKNLKIQRESAMKAVEENEITSDRKTRARLF